MARLFTHALLLLWLTSSTIATRCINPRKRVAWHTLSNVEKIDYLNAELCLMHRPAKLGLPGSRTRFDDFQAIHQLQSYATHFVGGFLPFHRMLLHVHEKALQEECGYTGNQPYWHEQSDAGNFSSSVIFDPIYGFGGDGSGDQECITTGPFANYTNSLGPGYSITDHCINRKINDTISLSSSQVEVDNCLSKTNFATTWPCIESQPHRGGHRGVGGQMVDGVASPGDPLFYLHHTWLDKIWWNWQEKDKHNRLKDMTGTNLGPEDDPRLIPRPTYIPRPTGAPGDPGTTTTLNHVLNMYGNGPNKTIADVMDIQGHLLCYKYIDP